MTVFNWVSNCTPLYLIVGLLIAVFNVFPVALAGEDAKPLRRLPDAAIPINLYELLGPDAYARGVIWQPAQCYAPTSERMEGVTEERLGKLEAMMMQDLFGALSRAANVSVTALNRNSSFPGLLGLDQARLDRDMRYRKQALRRLAGRPDTWRWLRALSDVVLRYTVASRDPVARVGHMGCVNSSIADLIGGKLLPLPSVDCSNSSSLVDALGFFSDPNLRMEQVARRVLREPGWCSVRPMYEPYGQWLKKERIMGRPRPGDLRFHGLSNRHADRVVFLFDLLYEQEHAFKRQHWLGAVVQQNPFDMYAIMDIIHTTQPDLVVETGTANGGSALMWASMLELTRPGSGRVITIDVNAPERESWAGVNAKDPTKNPLWAKYVTFLKGSSLDPGVLSTVRSAASSAARVVVLLDSDHTEHHVEMEASAYCPLVSPGSYCIVQDTKLSRFSSVGGPLPGIRKFLAKHPEFSIDRDREPFYTQHVGGYLRKQQQQQQ
ncbi:hypothetical protein Agub_g15433 [Astrephomene gubernaculifera]|uniref:Rhamnosyl O-methyltransferase n=1 Tax=Astrephomene gubernaculifera TaxID=47775 RepID=A0AAD3E326_9CHLO|nr:hypothetical protein Agub_g15433 [Astrephomene gubernaculifera]